MFERLFSDSFILKRYKKAGLAFGDMVSYLYMGECVGFPEALKRLKKWEAECARRGYRTISIDSFVESGGYGNPLEGLGARRAEGEDPIFHAQVYEDRFYGKVEPQVDLQKLLNDGVSQSGTYELPSTEE